MFLVAEKWRGRIHVEGMRVFESKEQAVDYVALAVEDYIKALNLTEDDYQIQKYGWDYFRDGKRQNFFIWEVSDSDDPKLLKGWK